MLVPCEVCDQVTTHIITEYTFKDMIMAPGSRYWFTKEVEVDEANCQFADMQKVCCVALYTTYEVAQSDGVCEVLHVNNIVKTPKGWKFFSDDNLQNVYVFPTLYEGIQLLRKVLGKEVTIKTIRFMAETQEF